MSSKSIAYPFTHSVARHRPPRATPRPTDAALLGLEHALRQHTDYELADQISLLVEVLPSMADQAMPRLRIASWLLRERLGGAA